MSDHLDAVLALQELDTELDRCRRRRAALAERAELAAIAADLAAVDHRLGAARAQRDAVTHDQQAMEQHLAAVESRAAEVKKRLYGGTVSATRDLQAMASELESLTARASELESKVLEVMEAAEPLDRRVHSIEGEKASRIADQAAMAERLALREAEVDAEIDVLNPARAAAAARVPDDLTATYEQLRKRLGGVGAARLVGARCGGCFLTLPATELDHLRHQPAGTLSFCDQCGRILLPAH